MKHHLSLVVLHATLILFVTSFLGCKQRQSDAMPKKSSAVTPSGTAKMQGALTASEKPRALVTSVNQEFRFVVLECMTGKNPKPGEVLVLFRGKDNVATVKVTEPFKLPFITADILDGIPRPGDQVLLLNGASSSNKNDARTDPTIHKDVSP
jgi:hypothetical protein